MTSSASGWALAIGILAGLGACDGGAVSFEDEAKLSSRAYPPGTAAPLSILLGPEQSEGTLFDKALDCSIALTVLASKIDQFNLAVSAKDKAALRRAQSQFERRSEDLAEDSRDFARIKEDRRLAAEEDVAGEMKKALRCLKSLAV